MISEKIVDPPAWLRGRGNQYSLHSLRFFTVTLPRDVARRGGREGGRDLRNIISVCSPSLPSHPTLAFTNYVLSLMMARVVIGATALGKGEGRERGRYKALISRTLCLYVLPLPSHPTLAFTKYSYFLSLMMLRVVIGAIAALGGEGGGGKFF